MANTEYVIVNKEDLTKLGDVIRDKTSSEGG